MSVETLEETVACPPLEIFGRGDSRRGLPTRIFKFFASLKLALCILFSLMAVLAVGTFLESYQGTDAARLVVYESAWFSALLVLLGINVTAAALDRLPWKRKHTGFVITHAGIVLILIGSFVTQRLMVDGQMMIAEGEVEHRITLPEPVLYIFPENGNRESAFRIQKKPFLWRGEKIIGALPVEGGRLVLKLKTYYPKARRRENIESSTAGPRALKVTLHNSFLNQSQWLLENHSALGAVQVGPALLKFTDTPLKENPGPAPEAGYLEFQFAGSKPQIPISSDLKLPASFELEGTGHTAKILRIFKNAAVLGRQLVEEPAGENPNPAVELMLEGKGISEKHTVFAKFPDFPTQHGMQPSAAGVRIFYRLPNAGSRGESHELRFVPLTPTLTPTLSPQAGRGSPQFPLSPKGEGENKFPLSPQGRGQSEGILYQLQTGFEVKSGRVKPGEDVATGWMDLAFRVDESLPHAQIRQTFTPEPNTSQSEEALPAIELEIEQEGKRQSFGLSQGTALPIEIAGSSYHFLYGEKRIPAGFQLKLRDFKIEHYPGTSRPASFESEVTLMDTSRGVSRDATIALNQPLIWRGWRIYQSGYSLPAGQPEISIFSVGRDPGIPVKYAGAVVLIAGILTMFYTRRFSSSEEKPE